jgi:hypothetical protein
LISNRNPQDSGDLKQRDSSLISPRQVRARLSRLFFFHRLKDVTVPLMKSILSGSLEKEEKSIFSLDHRERPTGHNCPSVHECLKWGWGIFRPQLQIDHAITSAKQ